MPPGTSEDEIKTFLLQKLPPQAPPLHITDVKIIYQKGHTPPRADRAVKTAPNTKIRMVFVGFRTSSEGHFVVRHFNHSFFRSSKLKVETAKGLQDVGETPNMKAKRSRLAAEGGSHKRGRAEGDDGGGPGRPKRRAARATGGGAGEGKQTEVCRGAAEGDGGPDVGAGRAAPRRRRAAHGGGRRGSERPQTDKQGAGRRRGSRVDGRRAGAAGEGGGGAAAAAAARRGQRWRLFEHADREYNHPYDEPCQQPC
ncbi:hypothetical protein STCU_11136 [Strigomonas culicis]|uniref:Uncharacterized protein n=1 Tax=Strigomonas culicis TaxID=28005 RepID=S9V1A0_9TRYP|nr:hypothetical protein STCU_11136 [Strigomonas culicis]|eukprot:EPY16565.1 hypothetical protein STCU_11136 [Strigomonas culicis]